MASETSYNPYRDSGSSPAGMDYELHDYYDDGSIPVSELSILTYPMREEIPTV